MQAFFNSYYHQVHCSHWMFLLYNSIQYDKSNLFPIYLCVILIKDIVRVSHLSCHNEHKWIVASLIIMFDNIKQRVNIKVTGNDCLCRSTGCLEHCFIDSWIVYIYIVPRGNNIISFFVFFNETCKIKIFFCLWTKCVQENNSIKPQFGYVMLNRKKKDIQNVFYFRYRSGF